MGRHTAPEDLGDVLVKDAEVPSRPRPRPRHAALDERDTDVIDPELVDRPLDEPPRNVVDADVIDDDPGARSVRTQSRPGKPLAELPAARPTPGPEAAPRPGVKPAKPKRERPGREDLRLLRASSSLRARSIAAVLLPFVLYTVALVVIGRMDAYLFWIWIPAILAGVLFGAQLDSAHKRSAATRE